MALRNKAIGVVLGIAVAAAVLLLQPRRPLPAPSLRLMPECGGAIRTIALQYTGESGAYSAPCYRAFLSSIDPGVEVVAVCASDADAAAFRRDVVGAAKRQVRTVVIGKPITGWCKDRFLVAAGSPAQLVHPPASETGLGSRTNDSLVAPRLAREDPGRFRAMEIPVKFDAGDIVATRSEVIISDALWRKNGRPREFGQQMERLFGQKVLWLKGAPDHHIGMFAAPLDNRTVIVGDPSLAKRLWTEAEEERFGRADFSPAAVRMLDRVAGQFRSAGYKVIRAPMAILAPQVYVTYTNGVFEKRGSRRIVYMPSYGSPRLDAAGRRAYESAGWEVRPIPVATVYRFRGTIGCLVNVLEREP